MISVKSIHITRVEIDPRDGWYRVHYTRCHDGAYHDTCVDDSLTFVPAAVDNVYHAANKAIKTLCSESHYNTPRENVTVTYADFWNGAYVGTGSEVDVQIVEFMQAAEKETPVVNRYVVTFEYYGYTVYTDGFPLFEEALQAAIEIASDRAGEAVEIEKNGSYFCTVFTDGSVEF